MKLEFTFPATVAEKIKAFQKLCGHDTIEETIAALLSRAITKEIKHLEESLSRMDAMDEEEVDSDEYQQCLAQLTKLRELEE